MKLPPQIAAVLRLDGSDAGSAPEAEIVPLREITTGDLVSHPHFTHHHSVTSGKTPMRAAAIEFLSCGGGGRHWCHCSRGKKPGAYACCRKGETKCAFDKQGECSCK